jgi:hypothetical protein
VEKQALSRGADAILRKPQSLAALAEAVRSLL